MKTTSLVIAFGLALTSLVFAPSAAAHDEPCGVNFPGGVQASGCLHNVGHLLKDEGENWCNWLLDNPVTSSDVECYITPEWPLG